MRDVVTTSAVFFSYALLAVFAQNAVFTRALGVSRLVQLVGDDRTSSWLFGIQLCITQVLVTPFAWYAGSRSAPPAGRGPPTPARRACDRFQLAQPEVRHNVAQDINILAHGRFGRPEEVAKIGKREDAVRLGGKNLHHSAHALVAADFVHGGIAPLSVVECESRCT